jgi:hypothetical protein
MAGPALGHDPAEEECRALVGRILASREFRRAHRLREFLIYIVDCKFAGSPQDAVETLIGHRVFSRPDSYNTGEDSIVRTEARILRQRLESYFAGAGLGEAIVLEIPKGSYLPVFRRREHAAPVIPTPQSGLRWLFVPLIAGLCVLVAIAAGWRLRAGTGRIPAGVPAPSARASVGKVDLDSSDPRLTAGFRWARQRALEHTYTGDTIGDWYESTVGTRHAFCMRDAAHQSVGAAVLGLTAHTRNMFRRFAAGIAAERSWCSYWEINKDGFPAPADYQDDQHFWYCLPANFDVMQACYRQFLWTGDPTYFDSVFSNFYDRTVTDYVAAWDRNHDGLMESSPRDRPRGIASYYQQEPHPLVAADLLAAQYKGYLVYAEMQEQRGVPGSLSRKLAQEYRDRAQALRTIFNTEWWNALQERHYLVMLPNRTFYSGYVADANVFPLLFEFTTEGVKTDAALDALEHNRPPFDQTFSYIPEILFHYGRNESAYRALLELTDPNFRGRGMPEVVFAAIGSMTAGLAGITPDAPHRTLETLSHLPRELSWVKLTDVPVLQNAVTITHKETIETTVTNTGGPPFTWRAAFAVSKADSRPQIVLDGRAVPAAVESRANQQTVVFTTITVHPGQTRSARLSKLTVN